VEHVQRRGLARLLLRWPDYRADLRRGVEQDPYLRELVEAYEIACEAVEYWTRSEGTMAVERAAEYRALLIATEQDILAKIV